MARRRRRCHRTRSRLRWASGWRTWWGESSSRRAPWPHLSPGPQPGPSPGPQPHTNLRRAVTQACDEVDAEEDDDAAVTALTARIFTDVREAGEEARYEGD